MDHPNRNPRINQSVNQTLDEKRITDYYGQFSKKIGKVSDNQKIIRPPESLVSATELLQSIFEQLQIMNNFSSSKVQTLKKFMDNFTIELMIDSLYRDYANVNESTAYFSKIIAKQTNPSLGYLSTTEKIKGIRRLNVVWGEITNPGIASGINSRNRINYYLRINDVIASTKARVHGEGNIPFAFMLPMEPSLSDPTGNTLALKFGYGDKCEYIWTQDVIDVDRFTIEIVDDAGKRVDFGNQSLHISRIKSLTSSTSQIWFTDFTLLPHGVITGDKFLISNYGGVSNPVVCDRNGYLVNSVEIDNSVIVNMPFGDGDVLFNTSSITRFNLFKIRAKFRFRLETTIENNVV